MGDIRLVSTTSNQSFKVFFLLRRWWSPCLVEWQSTFILKIEPVSQDFQLTSLRKISCKMNDEWGKKGCNGKRPFRHHHTAKNCSILSLYSFENSKIQIYHISLNINPYSWQSRYKTRAAFIWRNAVQVLFKITKSVICTNVILGIPMQWCL